MIKELIYASRSDYGSWCYYNCADFRTQKLLKDWTNPKRADYRKKFQTMQFSILQAPMSILARAVTRKETTPWKGLKEVE